MLLLGWSERLEQADLDRAAVAARAILPRRVDLPRVANSVRHVADGSAARDLVSQLRSTPVSAISLVFYDAFPSEPLELRSGAKWQDIRARRPMCIGLAAWLQA